MGECCGDNGTRKEVAGRMKIKYKYIYVGIEEDIHNILDTIKEKTGVSSRVIVNQALRNFFDNGNVREKIERKEYDGIISWFIGRKK